MPRRRPPGDPGGGAGRGGERSGRGGRGAAGWGGRCCARGRAGIWDAGGLRGRLCLTVLPLFDIFGPDLLGFGINRWLWADKWVTGQVGGRRRGRACCQG
jgi:hypothetical protein